MRLLLALVLITLLSTPATAQDSRLRQLLLSSAWCSFSHNETTGASRAERALFASNGTMTLFTGAQHNTSGPYGTSAGQREGSRVYSWKVEGGDLLLSEDRRHWNALDLAVRRDSRGNFVIVADGKEYTSCR